MARIEDSKAGRPDGGWTRTLGDKELGAVLSRANATVIRAGFELEKIIVEKALNIMTEAEAKAFVGQGNKVGAKKSYVITKLNIRKYLKVYLGCQKEPDYVILDIAEKKCYIVELKDGDTFDTKKAFGEIATLKEFATKFKKKFPLYRVLIKVCFFNSQDKAKIVKGFKNQITLTEAMTGKEFCTLLGVSFASITAQRENEGPENKTFFLKALIDIDTVEKILLNLLEEKANAARAINKKLVKEKVLVS